MAGFEGTDKEFTDVRGVMTKAYISTNEMLRSNDKIDDSISGTWQILSYSLTTILTGTSPLPSLPSH